MTSCSTDLFPKNHQWRYERKYLSTNWHYRHVESVIAQHPALFRPIYQQRSVNNIYLDSIDYHHYRMNVDGLQERVKVRVRWYGEMFGEIEKPGLELKIKDAAVGYKMRFDLQKFSLTRNFSFTNLIDFRDPESIQPTMRSLVSSLHPTLLNGYKRKYFLSSCGRFRLTLDWDLQYFRIFKENNNFLCNYRSANAVVVELKYDVDHESHAREIADSLPFPITRNSKYVVGLQSLQLV